MTLSDYEIVEWCTPLPEGIPSTRQPMIEPFIKENLQPASVDLTLAREFLRYPWRPDDVDPILLDQVKKHPVEMDKIEADSVMIPPMGFMLGRTQEWVNIPANMVASVEGKSSLARLGIFVHVTAGFIDPGFRGTITLEFFNASPRYIGLVAGIHICQIAFTRMSRDAMRPYGSPGLGSKYQNQSNTTSSRYQG